MVSKLAKRGFVKKEVSPTTDNEVLLTLTETGKNVYYAHEKQHQQLKVKLADVFEKYPTDTLDILLKIGTDIKKRMGNSTKIINSLKGIL